MLGAPPLPITTPPCVLTFAPAMTDMTGSASAPKKLFLLDAFALIYRAHFAFSKNPRINSKEIGRAHV